MSDACARVVGPSSGAKMGLFNPPGTYKDRNLGDFGSNSALVAQYDIILQFVEDHFASE
jgi:hypothetical protein